MQDSEQHDHHAGIRGDALSYLVRVAGGRDAGADIQELPDSGLGGQVPGRPAEEGPVGRRVKLNAPRVYQEGWLALRTC